MRHQEVIIRQAKFSGINEQHQNFNKFGATKTSDVPIFKPS
jgi:hypothetical protein